MSAIKFSGYALGPLAAQLIAMACLPIYTRVYSQKSIGDFQVISTYVLFLMPFVTFGFNSLIVRSVNSNAVLSAFITCLLLSSVIATILLSALCVIAGYNINCVTLFIAYLYIFSSAILVVFYQYTVRLEDSLRYAMTYLVFSFSSNITKVVFGLYVDDVSSILLAFALSSFFVIFLSGRSVSFVGRMRINLGDTRLVLARNIRFQSQVSLLQLIAVATEWVGVAALPFLGFSSELIAVAGVAQLVTRSSIYPFGNAIYNLLVMKIQDSPKSFFNIIRVIAPAALLASCLFSFVISQYGEIVFELLLGEGWGKVGAISLSLSIGTFAVIFLQPLARAIAIGLNQTSSLTYAELAGLIITLVIVYFCNLYEAPLELYFAWIAFAFLALSMLKLVLLHAAVRDFFKKL